MYDFCGEDAADSVSRLEDYGVAALPMLIGALDHWSNEARVVSCRILERMGGRAVDAIPALRRIVDGSGKYEDYVVTAAREAFARIRSDRGARS